MTGQAALLQHLTVAIIQRRALTISQGLLHRLLLLRAAATMAEEVTGHQVAAAAGIVAAATGLLQAAVAAAVALHQHLLPAVLLLKAHPVQREGMVDSNSQTDR